MELYGSAKIKHLHELQLYQSKLFRLILYAPWNVKKQNRIDKPIRTHHSRFHK